MQEFGFQDFVRVLIAWVPYIILVFLGFEGFLGFSVLGFKVYGALQKSRSDC